MLNFDVTIETEFRTIVANEHVPTADEVGELIAGALEEEPDGGEFTITVTACESDDEQIEDEP